MTQSDTLLHQTGIISIKNSSVSDATDGISVICDVIFFRESNMTKNIHLLITKRLKIRDQEKCIHFE